MEINENERDDVKQATPVDSAILSGNKDENNRSKGNKEKSARTTRLEEGDPLPLNRKRCNLYRVKFPPALIKTKKPCHKKVEIICRENLTKDEYIEVLSTPKRSRGLSCKLAGGGKSSVSRPPSQRLTELARPKLSHVKNLLETWGDKLRPEIIDAVQKSIETNCAMSPEQMEAYYNEKNRDDCIRVRRVKRKKCTVKEKKKKKSDDQGMDPEIVCEEYEMAQRFMRHIISHLRNSPFSPDDHYDLTETILSQLGIVLDYRPSGDGDRKFQMMFMLANGIACWVHGLNNLVAEKLAKQKQEIDEKDEESDDEEDIEEEDKQDGEIIEEITEEEDDDETEKDGEKEEVEEEKEEEEEVEEEEVEEEEVEKEEVVEEEEEEKEDDEKDIEGTEIEENEANGELESEQVEDEEVPRGKGDTTKDEHPSETDRASEPEENEETIGPVEITDVKITDEESEENIEPDESMTLADDKEDTEVPTELIEEDEKLGDKIETEEEKDETKDMNVEDMQDVEKEKMSKDSPSIPSIGEPGLAIKELGEGDLFGTEIPFVTFGKIMEIVSKFIDKYEEAETTGVRRRLQNAVLHKLTNLIVAELPDALDDKLKAVLEILAENIAVFLEDTLPESKLDVVREITPEIESTEVRNWSHWLESVMDTATNWGKWIHEKVGEAEEKARVKVTRGDWQDWTSTFNAEALQWRMFNLNTKHRMHHADLNIAYKNVVHRGGRETRNSIGNVGLPSYPTDNNETEIEAHELYDDTQSDGKTEDIIEFNEPEN